MIFNKEKRKVFNSILLIVVLTITCGCNLKNEKKELNILKTKFNDLEKENIKLKDSIERLVESKLSKFKVIAIPYNDVQKVNSKNKIGFAFLEYNLLFPEQEVYIKTKDTIKKIGTNKSTLFEYDFIPKNTKDNKLHLMFVEKNKNKPTTIEVSINLKTEN